ncbi:MAG: hypothetical protein J0H78_13080 [Rhizobiales bacterium]|nr:hypothetical protein [Hyphomicrobiales bacterium]OJY43465.1 MAG: hypothetical protein BGP08_01410 [Rhizobiales bacterium 64-17]
MTRRRGIPLLLALLLAAPQNLRAQAADDAAADPNDGFASVPAFSPGDLPARRASSCEELRVMADALAAQQSARGDDPDTRVDLTLAGPLVLVQRAGPLWYLVMCRDLRVMCVTYQDNGMKPGDRVTMKGAYRRVDQNHALLDPCLANAD